MFHTEDHMHTSTCTNHSELAQVLNAREVFVCRIKYLVHVVISVL